MLKDPIKLSIYDLSYPCYVAAVPLESERIIHVPGLYEYKNLDNTFGFVIEGYRTKDITYLFDCMKLELWNKKKCLIFYENRLKTLRGMINDEIGRNPQLTDLPMVLVDDPMECKDYCENLLQFGITSVRIMSPTGYYVFGQAKNEEYLEMNLEQKI